MTMTTGAANANSKKLRFSPLVYTVAAIELSPVLSMRDYITNKLQDSLRKAGYPDFTETSSVMIRISQDGFENNATPEWRFVDDSSTTSIRITPQRLVLETSAYNTFAHFLSVLSKIMKIFEDIVGPMTCQRIGLRYVNIIQAPLGQDMGNILHSALSGHGEQFGDTINPTFSAQYQGQTQAGLLLVRVYPALVNHLLPPDLADTSVIVKSAVDTSRPLRFLDIDHIQIDKFAFKSDDIIKRIESLHENIEKAFIQSVQPSVYQSWSE